MARTSDDAQRKPYHHGGLREAVIAAAVAEVQAVGADAVSLREIARRAGVSHAAPAYHFGDRAGVFTAIAIEGFRLAADAIRPAATGPFGFLDGGAAYVTFALIHRGHFEVMFRPALLRADDPQLDAARADAFSILDVSAVELARRWRIDDITGLTITGWSLSHGLATLLLAGNLTNRLPADPSAIRTHLHNGLIGLGKAAKSQRAESSATDTFRAEATHSAG